MFAFRPVPIGAVFFLFVAIAGAHAASVSEFPPAPFPSPLQSAVRDVWKNSPEVQGARAELDAEEARARAADQPLYNPTVGVDVENADVNRRTVGLSLALDLSGKRRARAEQRHAQLRASEATFNSLRRDIASRWLKGWAATALASRQTELGRNRVELMQRFDDLAAQRLKVGDISSPERDLAGLALGEAQVQQASLIGNEAAARSTLIAIVGEDLGTLPPLPQQAPPATDGFPLRPVDELSEIIEARAQLENADAGIRVANRARIPDPAVSLTGGRVHVGPVTDQVIGLSISIPLPVLNNGRAEVEAARADADAAAAVIQSRRLILRATQGEARTRYEALRVAAEAFRTGRASAFQDRTALLEKLWRSGEVSTSDYLVQLKQSLDTALSGLELESHAWQAWFTYLSAAGHLTDWIDGRTQDVSP